MCCSPRVWGKLYFSELDCTKVGENIYQSPIWIRPNSLFKANKGTYIHKNYIQIFGHTKINKIDYRGKTADGSYLNVDALNGNDTKGTSWSAY